MNLNSLYLLLHVISAAIWVGGMYFAYMCLRPVAASQLEPPLRLRLWVGVFTQFFPVVWITVVLLPVTGYAMIFSIWQSMAVTPLYVHIMNGLGTLMLLIYMHVYFAPFKRLKKAVLAEQWPAGGAALAQIRQLIAVNLSLGLLVIAVASAGRYFA
ncbi:MAG: CopD family protein [Gammaproteobacteria bacterium]|nr:CopD family protein [Gammaproteobacteria bacterium]